MRKTRVMVARVRFYVARPPLLRRRFANPSRFRVFRVFLLFLLSLLAGIVAGSD